MITRQDLLAILELINETLTATVVIVAVSILLYNLTRDTKDRVMRASAIVLLGVIIAYLGDVFVSLQPGQEYLESWLRLQWIGIAIVPAALLHLSDALLATTGRPSRGRRTLAVRVAYAIGALLAVLAVFTDSIVGGLRRPGAPYFNPGPAFPLYVLYTLPVGLFALINVFRARQRCLTRYTQRRMTYLLAVFLAPLYGVFPFSLLGDFGAEHELQLLVVINVANLIVVLMLVFMAYPLSFFGSEKPDRVIKSQLLEFMLRGPLTGAAVLAAILFVPRATNILGLHGDAFMPFAAVATLLFLQWSITLTLPILQRWLVYTEDQQRAQWIQRLGDRLLTPADAAQLLESILAAACDHLRVPTAFVARVEPDGAQLVQVVGALAPSSEALTAPELSALARTNGETVHADLRKVGAFFVWRSFWLIPLHTPRAHGNGNGTVPLLGLLGLWARAPEPDLTADEQDLLDALARQAARVLEGVQHQSEIFVLLEGLASQMDQIQELRGSARYGQVADLTAPSAELLSDPDFANHVKDALRDYWGGPRLTESELLRLNIVWREMEERDERNPARALRTVLAQAIENLKPEGQRSLTTTEWILYNILEMRFLQGRKVRDVALRLAMSESDLYRKQRIAIEEVARQIEAMERKVLSENGAPVATANGAHEPPSR